MPYYDDDTKWVLIHTADALSASSHGNQRIREVLLNILPPLHNNIRKLNNTIRDHRKFYSGREREIEFIAKNNVHIQRCQSCLELARESVKMQKQCELLNAELWRMIEDRYPHERFIVNKESTIDAKQRIRNMEKVIAKSY